MSTKRRDKKKIPTHMINKYMPTDFDSESILKLENSLNGNEKHPKNRIKDIISNFSRIKFKNGKQKDFHKMLTEKEVVVCQGSAGTGKTYIAVYSALRALMDDNDIFKIILTKPSQQLKDENMGFIKGGVDEKIAPIMESFDDIFEELIGKQAFKTLVEEGIIVHLPLSFIRGKTLKNSIIIFDEVQMSTLHICRTLMQRFGEASKLYLLGDEVQVERGNRKNNPLTLIYNKFNLMEKEEFGTFRFELSDVVRNPLITVFETMFDEIEKEIYARNTNKEENK